MQTIDKIFLTPFLYIFIAIALHVSLFLYVKELTKKSSNWVRSNKIRFVVFISFFHLVLALLQIPLFHFIVSSIYPLVSGQDMGWGYGVGIMWILVVAGGAVSALFSSAYILLSLQNKFSE